MTDDDLRNAFAKLRELDARRAPTFEALADAPARRRSRWVIALPIASVTAAAAAFVVWVTASKSDTSASLAPVPAAPTLEDTAAPAFDPAPLDFLLELPTSASLAGVPNFDRSLVQGPPR
jgi:hypothetical protein